MKHSKPNNRKQPPTGSGKQSSLPPNCTDHYPPGELPALTRKMLKAVVQKFDAGQLPTEKELDVVLKERKRATKKITWALTGTRPDLKERALSANATVVVTLGLDTLTAQSLDYREQQRNKASRPRTPIDGAASSELKNSPHATAREVWDALSNYKEGNVQITATVDLMQWDCGGKQGNLKFVTFKSKISRLRKTLRLR